jgi:hypothetical protein
MLCLNISLSLKMPIYSFGGSSILNFLNVRLKEIVALERDPFHLEIHVHSQKNQKYAPVGVAY